MFEVSIRHDDRVRNYFVSNGTADGWEIKREENHRPTKHVWCHDWHRVERSLERFRREIADLTAQGWQVDA